MFWKKKPEVTPVKENEKKTNVCDETECIRMPIKIDINREYEEAVRKLNAVKGEIKHLYSNLRQKQFAKCVEADTAYVITLQNGKEYLANVPPVTDDKWFSFYEYMPYNYVMNIHFRGDYDSCFSYNYNKYYIKNIEPITINTEQVVSIRAMIIPIASEKIPEVGEELEHIKNVL